MDILRNLGRGAAAALAAFAVMGSLAVVALSRLETPVTWSLVAAVLATAVGGSATLTGSLDTGLVPIALEGTIDVLPLGLSGPGALVFCAILAGPVRAARTVTTNGRAARTVPASGRAARTVPASGRAARTVATNGRAERPGPSAGTASAVRTAGAAVAAGAVLAAVVNAGSARVDLALPLGAAPATGLVVRPDTSSTLTGGLLAVVLLGAGCGLVSRLRCRRAVAAVPLAAVGALVVVGLVVAVLLVPRNAALAGVALLFGANAVLMALLGGFGAPSTSLPSPLQTAAGDHGWLLGSAGPIAVRLVALGVLIVACAAPLAFAAPVGGDRWHRAGLRAVVSGSVLAVVLAALTVVSAGSLALGVSVVVFRTQVLALHVGPAVGWALLAGAVAGGAAGFVGSLLADVRWRARLQRAR